MIALVISMRPSGVVNAQKATIAGYAAATFSGDVHFCTAAASVEASGAANPRNSIPKCLRLRLQHHVFGIEHALAADAHAFKGAVIESSSDGVFAVA
jgi:hypothetical protein